MHHLSRYSLGLLFALLTICGFRNILFSQDSVRLERFTTEQGLSSNVIYSMLQDSQGYIWIGTDQGLHRFDGYEFKAFHYDPNNIHSLPSNAVYTLCEDSSGTLWIGTQGGLCFLEPGRNKISRINLGIKTNVMQIVETRDGGLLMVLEGYIMFYDIKNGEQSRVAIGDGKQRYIVSTTIPKSLSRSISGNIYLVGQTNTEFNTIFLYDEKKRKFENFEGRVFMDIDAKLCSYFFEDRNRNYWLAPGNPCRLLKYSRKEGVIMKSLDLPIGIEKGITNEIFQDLSGNLWIATTGGFFFYDIKANILSGNLLENYQQSGTIPATCFLQDRTGLLWAGCLNGLYKVSPRQNKFRSLTTRGATNKRLLNNFVVRLKEEYPNQVRIDYYWGVSQYSFLDLNNFSIRHEKKSSKSFDEHLQGMIRRNPDNFTKPVYDRSYAALKLHGLDIDKYRSALLFDRYKNAWLFNEGLLRKLNDSSFQLLGSVADVVMVGDHIYLARYNSGLSIVDTKTGMHTNYSNRVNAKDSISSNQLTCLLPGADSRIWLGTKGGGLSCFNPRQKVFINYSTKDGLPSNSIYSMVMDGKGRLWLGTGNGLSCFDTSAKTFHNFFRSDGLTNSEFNRFSAFRAGDGTIFMGGMDGIDYFHSDSIMREVVRPVVAITDFKVFNESFAGDSSVSLPHKKNYVSIDFTVMDFRNIARNEFAYMLAGIDKDWIYAGTRRSVNYANLSPGRYRFLVKAKGSNGAWSGNIAEIRFRILPPWWLNPWFIAGSSVALLLVFMGVYRFRVKQLKRIIKVRSKISQDLHDEVGATLTAISYLSEVAKQDSHDTNTKVTKTVDKIGEFSRNMIDEMNDIVWAINPSNDKFERIEDRMQDFGTILLQSRNIKFNLQVEKDVKNLLLGMQQRKNVYLIFKEALNNAAKYSGCSQVDLSVFRENNHINFVIKDNGKGFLPTSGEKGIGGNGLRNIRTRAEEMNARITIKSGPGEGTSISVSFPITPFA